MAINPLAQTTTNISPPQPDLKAENKTQPAGKQAAENTPPVAKDTVTISKAAAMLKAKPDTPKAEATKASPETAKETKSGAAQATKLLAEQANAVEIQKSTTGNPQEPRGATKINRMI